MSFLDFYQYLGLFSMVGRHVPLWERCIALGKRDSACGREILPVEELYPCGREILSGMALSPEKKNENPKYEMEILKKYKK